MLPDQIERAFRRQARHTFKGEALRCAFWLVQDLDNYLRYGGPVLRRFVLQSFGALEAEIARARS